jgi:hypothetical protein
MVALDTSRNDLRAALTRTSLREDQCCAVERLNIKAARSSVTDPTCERAGSSPKRPDMMATHAIQNGYLMAHRNLPVGI